MPRSRRTAESEAPTEIIVPPERERSRWRNWNTLEIALLVALMTSIIALSVVTIAAGKESAAESGLRGLTLILASALTGMKLRNGKG